MTKSIVYDKMLETIPEPHRDIAAKLIEAAAAEADAGRTEPADFTMEVFTTNDTPHKRQISWLQVTDAAGNAWKSSVAEDFATWIVAKGFARRRST